MNGGDILLVDQPDGGEISFVNGEPVFDDGLSNAVYVSLFSSPRWWGNLIAKDAEKYRINLDEFRGQTLTNSLRLDIIQDSFNALDWLITSGIAQSIDVDATIPKTEVLELAITVNEPSASRIFTFKINWDNQLDRN